MKPKTIVAVLKVLSTIGFYLMVFFTLFVIVTSVLNIAGRSKINSVKNGSQLSYRAIALSLPNTENGPGYSKDSVIQYQAVHNEFIIKVQPDSGLGYYAALLNIVYMLFGTGILWCFMKIFKMLQLEQPFAFKIIRKLNILAGLFIVSDIVKILDYVIANQFIHQSLNDPKLALISTIGNGLLTGFIIWIIAIIYQRGVALQTESDLTV